MLLDEVASQPCLAEMTGQRPANKKQPKVFNPEESIFYTMSSKAQGTLRKSEQKGCKGCKIGTMTPKYYS